MQKKLLTFTYLPTGPTWSRTRVDGFKVHSTNHYTIGPLPPSFLSYVICS